MIKYGNIARITTITPNTVSFIPNVTSTSGRLHCEFVRLLFLLDHRETDRFFADSGVQFAQSDRGQFRKNRGQEKGRGMGLE
jgi:hypothetical protein